MICATTYELTFWLMRFESGHGSLSFIKINFFHIAFSQFRSKLSAVLPVDETPLLPPKGILLGLPLLVILDLIS